MCTAYGKPYWCYRKAVPQAANHESRGLAATVKDALWNLKIPIPVVSHQGEERHGNPHRCCITGDLQTLASETSLTLLGLSFKYII